MSLCLKVFFRYYVPIRSFIRTGRGSCTKHRIPGTLGRACGRRADPPPPRSRAYLDLLLGTDSRPLDSHPDSTHGQDTSGPQDEPGGGEGEPGPSGPGGSGPSGPSDPAGPFATAPGGPLAGVIPPGFAARVNLTIPATTALHLARRPRGDGRDGPDRPRSRSTYIRSLPGRDVTLVDPGSPSIRSPSSEHRMTLGNVQADGPGTGVGVSRARTYRWGTKHDCRGAESPRRL